MKFLRVLLAVSFIAQVSACESAPRSRIAFLESEDHAGTVQAAVALVNLLLPNGPTILAETDSLLLEGDGIRVRAGVPIPTGAFGPALANRGEILVDVTLVDQLHSLFSAGLEVEGLLPLEELLALVLLHEVGHVVLGHSEGRFQSARGGPFNVEMTEGELRELEADQWAARGLKAAIDSPVGRDQEIAALSIAMWLHIMGVSIIVQRVERDESIDPPSSVFGESGYSHPNLELRLLTMLSVLDPEGNEGFRARFEERRAALRKSVGN